MFVCVRSSFFAHSLSPCARLLSSARVRSRPLSSALVRSRPLSSARRYEEAFKTPGSKIVAARILLETVISAALGGVGSEDVAEFMAALLETRYAPMLPRLAPFMQLNSRRFKCLRSKKALYKRIEPKALVAAEPMARLFAVAIGGRAVSPAIRTILLRDFVEETLANVVEPNDVPILIANCWPPAAGDSDILAAA